MKENFKTMKNENKKLRASKKRYYFFLVVKKAVRNKKFLEKMKHKLKGTLNSAAIKCLMCRHLFILSKRWAKVPPRVRLFSRLL